MNAVREICFIIFNISAVVAFWLTYSKDRRAIPIGFIFPILMLFVLRTVERVFNLILGEQIGLAYDILIIFFNMWAVTNVIIGMDAYIQAIINIQRLRLIEKDDYIRKQALIHAKESIDRIKVLLDEDRVSDTKTLLTVLQKCLNRHY